MNKSKYHNYMNDDRSFSICLKEWSKLVGGRKKGAELLVTTYENYNKWCDGSRKPSLEFSIRKLMTLELIFLDFPIDLYT